MAGLVAGAVGQWTDWAGRAVAPALLYGAVASAVVLGVAAVAVLLMRRRASAAARHEAWLLGFVAALLLPLLSAALPAWRVLPRVPWSTTSVATSATPRARSESESTVAPARSTANDASPTRTEAPTHERAPGVADAPSSTIADAPDAKTSTDPTVISFPTTITRFAQAPPHAANPADAPRRMTWTTWLVLVWAVGALLVLGRVALGHLSLRMLRRRADITPIADGEIVALFDRLRGEMGVGRRVELLSSSDRTVPMTWGLWRARLLLPEQVSEWPAARRRDVLLHELGHLVRWDCQTQFLSQVACAVYWFNPLAWLAARRMLIERERACDDLVLSRGGAEAPAYARHLLQSVSSVQAARWAGAAAVAMARPSTLEERMRAILDTRMNRRAVTARGTAVTVLLLLLALVPAAVLRAQAEAGNSDSQPRAGGGGGGSTASGTREGREAPPPPPDSRPAPRARGGGGASGYGGAGGNSFGGGPAGFRGGGGGFGGGGGSFGGAPPYGGGGNPADGPTCTFDVTVYDVRIPVEQIGKLDVDALAKASDSAESFEKALAALGKLRPMYRVNQSVRLSGDNITIGSEVPVVTNSRTTDRGQAYNTINYQSVGAHFTINGNARGGGPQDGIDLDLGIEISSSSDTGTALTENVTAPIMRRATMSHKGPVQPKRPFVIVSVDANSVDKEGKAVACIGRITLGEPHDSRPPRSEGGEGGGGGGYPRGR